MGSYGPNVDLNYTTTPSSELSALGDKSIVVSGCKITQCVDYDSPAVISAVKSADVTFLCLGTGEFYRSFNVFPFILTSTLW